MTKAEDTRLSYSSSNTITACEQKYWHYKVNNTEVDSDANKDTTALTIGKAFHDVLERTNHTAKDIQRVLVDVVDEYELPIEHHALIESMLIKYLHLHSKVGLKVVHCELKLENEIFLGFVDAIMKDDDGGWWVVDLKTAARVYPTVFSRLHNDAQLNLYSYFAGFIANALGLDPKKFKGTRYRVTTKPSLKQRASESHEEYVKRLFDRAESLDIIIPVEKMNPKAAWDRFKNLYDRSMELRNGAIPTKNYGACESYFRPCEYWSQCYGREFSELSDNLEVIYG